MHKGSSTGQEIILKEVKKIKSLLKHTALLLMQVADMKSGHSNQKHGNCMCAVRVFFLLFFSHVSCVLIAAQTVQPTRDSWWEKPTKLVTSVARRLAQRLAPSNLTARRSRVQFPGGRGLSCVSSLRLCPFAAPVSPPSGNMDCEVNIQSALDRTRIRPQGLCTGG